MKKISIVVAIILIFLIYIEVSAPVDRTEGPKKQPDTAKSITINFVGDILAARTIESTMRKNGYDYPFQKIHEELADADITFANLETPLIGNQETGKTTPGGLTVFRGDVDFAKALKDAGIDIVSIANNHMKDQGEDGVVSTINALEAVKVAHAGAGIDLNQARKLAIIEKNGIKVGFLAYNDTDVVPPSTYANNSPQSGTNTMDQNRLVEDIGNARAQVDILVVSMHSGTEYITSKPNSRQTAFAHAAIDAGSDMVIGHHPHVLQPMEIYKNKYIFYSLGNFVFDQPWPDTKESVILKMGITLHDGTQPTITPTITPLVLQNFQPQKTNDAEVQKRILHRFTPNPKLLTLGSKTIFVEMATKGPARELGLSGRAALPKETGLLFVFDGQNFQGIWMKDMLFPIDIFWFDASFNLVDKRLSVKPDTYPDVFYPKLKATYVLETPVGLFDPMSLTQGLTGELTLLNSYDKR